MGRLPLLLYPALKVIARWPIETEKHLGVLRPAILCALSQVESGLLRLYPGVVWVVRNQVGLARQPWHPETMIRICGQQFERSGTSCRHVQLIRSHNI